MTLTLEIGIALVLVLAMLCAKPEYGLFLYGLALGFPDVAVPIGTAINLRLDDVLIVLFLFRSMIWIPAPLGPGQRKIFGAQTLFFFACVLSVAIETVRGNPPEPYDTAKMIGCAAIVLVLPRLVESERRLRFLIAGLLCAGFALVIQMIQHLGTNLSNAYSNFQQLKSAGSFATWNPNTIGQAASLLVFAAGLGGIFFSKTRTSRIAWSCLAIGFALLPASMFVRTTTLSILAGFILFLCLLRRWKWVLLFAAGCLAIVLYLRSMNPQIVNSAVDINVETGEGFSDRYERWDMALRAIRTAPFLGQGFGQELSYLSLMGSEGRAHDAYLAVWLELGLGGLILFLIVIVQFARAGWSLHRNPRFQLEGDLILALIFALSLDSLALPTLYWEKLPTIAMSLAVTVVGLCERNEPALANIEARTLHREPVAQIS